MEGLVLLPVLLSLAPQVVAQAPAEGAATEPAVEPVRVSSTAVSLTVPASFTRARNFTGFIDLATQSSILVTVVSGSYEEVSAGFEDEDRLEAQGLQLVWRRELAYSEEVPGALLALTQSQGGVPVLKRIRLFGSEATTILVVGTFFDSNETERVEAIVRSASWDPDFQPDPLEGLAFTLTEAGGLKLFGNTGGVLGWNLGGEVDESGKHPSFLCAPSLRPVFGDRRDTAETRFKSLEYHENVRLESLEPIEIDGLAGFEARGQAVNSTGGGTNALHLVMLFEGATYWFLAGTVSTELSVQYLPHFEEMARSFRRHRDLLQTPGRCQIEVPATWAVRSGLGNEADLQAGHPVNSCYLTVSSYRKDEFESEVTFDDFVTWSRGGIGDLILERESRTTKATVGEHPAMRTELRGVLDGEELSWLILAVDGNHSFHALYFWAPSSLFRGNLRAFSSILESFRELE